MALQRKQQPISLGYPAKRYPERVPSLPEETVSRFPSLSDWHMKMSEWWYDFRTALVRDLDDLASQISALRALIDQQDQTDNVALLTQRVDALELLINSSVGDISTSITEIIGDLTDHIGRTIVHGTISDVVGETDDQILEDKQIGFTTPDYGRFTHSMAGNTIPAADALYVPAAHHMVIAGTYSVVGVLTVDGTVAFV